MLDEIMGLVEGHQEWREKQCLNLIPSENVMSPAVRTLLSSDLGHRYTTRDRFYMGTSFIDKIECYGEEIAKEIFRVKIADLRPLSGHISDLIFLVSFAQPGDTLMCVSPEDGGYPGLWRSGLAGLFDLKTVPFPYSRHNRNIDIEKAKETIIRKKPRLVVFGASLIAFPHPVRELAGVAREVGAIVGFDGTHVMGLIGGGEFQDPLREGASALFGSTHKTLFGPQGGIILADEQHGELMQSRVYPAIVDNAHWNRIAALTLALAELREFGEGYAKQVIANSQTLAHALNDLGFPVVCPHLGFTQSHQAILDYGGFKQGRIVAEKLERVNIIVDCGVRVGTCEVTRRGMKEEEMLRMAEMMRSAVASKTKPETLRKEVIKLCQEFPGFEYCFQD